MVLQLILTGLMTFWFMEFVAWFTHKFVMHCTLWMLHKDHHVPPKQKKHGFFKKNDWFFIIFAAPSMILYILGSLYENAYFFAIAIGISLYGVAYFVFHEIVFHRRLNIRWIKKWNGLYVRALRRAHANHHKHLSYENGECFGLLVFPLKFFKMEMGK